jgi:protein SCO1/2
MLSISIVMLLTTIVRAQPGMPSAGVGNGVAGSNVNQNAVPSYLKDVGIDQKLGAQLPLDAVFTDETGKEVKLSDYFGKRPVVLALVYYQCPMLCTLVLNDLGKALNAMKPSAGEDFDIVTISFDPTETAAIAATKKKNYVSGYRRAHAQEGWHFLTGTEDSIHAVTDAVGFRYTFDPKFKQFVHAGGIMVLTPSGKVSKYFYGVEYSARDIQLALIDANEGKVGSASEVIMHYCFQYDPATGKYSLAVLRLLRVAAILTLTVLGGFLFLMFRRERQMRLAHEAKLS